MSWVVPTSRKWSIDFGIRSDGLMPVYSKISFASGCTFRSSEGQSRSLTVENPGQDFIEFVQLPVALSHCNLKSNTK